MLKTPKELQKEIEYKYSKECFFKELDDLHYYEDAFEYDKTISTNIERYISEKEIKWAKEFYESKGWHIMAIECNQLYTNRGIGKCTKIELTPLERAEFC
jgi:hypothetical protein